MKPLRLIQTSLAAAGIGLGFAALWTDTVRSESSQYWNAGGMAGKFPLALLIICSLLVMTNVVLRLEWLRAIAAAIGAILLGFFLLFLAILAPHLGRLDFGAWFGIAGAILIVAGTIPPPNLAVPKPALDRIVLDRVLALWLVAAVGLALGLVALGLDIVKLQKLPAELKGQIPHYEITYWSFRGDHSLGVFVLVLALLALISVGGAIVLRARALGVLALGTSLVFLGLVLFYPALAAFSKLGQLGAGAWVALAGALLASSAATLALLLNRETGPA